MNEGLVAAAVQCHDLIDENQSDCEPENDDVTDLLPPDFALVGGFNSEPGSLDKALRGPDSKEWQTALEYEINQLEKLGTWVIEDLPKEHNAIPCGEVLKIKRGLNGEIQSYQVWIVAGGHRQVEGVNYTETFSTDWVQYLLFYAEIIDKNRKNRAYADLGHITAWSFEGRAGREGFKATERPVWFEASWKGMVSRNE